MHGNWKAVIRLHHGNSLTAVPIHLEGRRDPGRREGACHATLRSATFAADHLILQRKRRPAAGVLTVIAYLVASWRSRLSLLALLALGPPPAEDRDWSRAASRERESRRLRRAATGAPVSSP